MAYQNISTPRIYLNIPEYLSTTGLNSDSVFRTLPVGENSISSPTVSISIPAGILGTQCFIAVLGHTLKTNNQNYSITEQGTLVDVVNGTPADGYDGFSISTFDANGETSITVTGITGNMSIVTGIYWEFPHSPDLSLSLSYEYDGIKEVTTKGGNTLTNSFYNKPPSWNGLGAWELGGEAKYAKSGRRIWSLNWSYLSDSSTFPTTSALSNVETSAVATNPTDNTLLDYDSFQRVVHLCNGGQIPFIFQPDNSVSENFAIAKFDMKSFKFSQQAPNLYRVSLKIREVW